MSNMLRKIKKNIEVKEIQGQYKKKPKTRCLKCHKMSLWIKDKKGQPVCVRCSK